MHVYGHLQEVKNKWTIIKPAENLFTRGSNNRPFLCQIWCFALVAALTWRFYSIPLNE